MEEKIKQLETIVKESEVLTNEKYQLVLGNTKNYNYSYDDKRIIINDFKKRNKYKITLKENNGYTDEFNSYAKKLEGIYNSYGDIENKIREVADEYNEIVSKINERYRTSNDKKLRNRSISNTFENTDISFSHGLFPYYGGTESIRTYATIEILD